MTPMSSGATLRTYRVAIGATGEFTQQFGGQAGALSAITDGINAANAILEKEAAIRLVLIANETAIIYTNPATDPYTPGPFNDDLATMAQENHDTLTTVIGTANYDLGHVFHYGNGLAAQGYAFFGVCTTEWKDIAGTIFWGVPPSHTIGLRTLLHEFGHQFTAYHSFNGTTNSCAFGRNPEGAYEPGSGSSIMSYSDLCGAENVPSTSLYNAGALEQVINYSSSGFGNSCAAPAATGNTPPTVDAGPSYTIPASTPFMLTATGSDADLDPVTYSWEQFDLGNATPPNTDDGTRPLFRIYNPTTSPARMFPELSFILSNTTAVGQALPTTNRTLTMRVVARDNRAGGGGVTTDDTILTVHAAAGPFVVTAPNTAVTWTAGTNQTVTWHPAGTTGAPISVADVRILLSTDNGQTFPTVLAASTPNDGSQSITVPNIPTTTARVKIEAIGNIFISDPRPGFRRREAGNSPSASCASSFPAPDCWSRPHGASRSSTATASSSSVHGASGVERRDDRLPGFLRTASRTRSPDHRDLSGLGVRRRKLSPVRRAGADRLLAVAPRRQDAPDRPRAPGGAEFLSRPDKPRRGAAHGVHRSMDRKLASHRGGRGVVERPAPLYAAGQRVRRFDLGVRAARHVGRCGARARFRRAARAHRRRACAASRSSWCRPRWRSSPSGT